MTINGAEQGESVTLTFTPGNWQSSQTVTVAAVDDDLAETEPHTASLAHTVASGDAGFDGMAVYATTVLIGENDCGGVEPLAGDFDGNCTLNLLDFAIFTGKYLTCSIGLCN